MEMLTEYILVHSLSAVQHYFDYVTGLMKYFTVQIYCRNTWVTLTTFLGCISVTKECYQVGFLTGSSLRSFSLLPFARLFFQKKYLATFLVFLPQACNQGTLQGQMCKIKETTNLTRNADL